MISKVKLCFGQKVKTSTNIVVISALYMPYILCMLYMLCIHDEINCATLNSFLRNQSLDSSRMLFALHCMGGSMAG